MTIRSRSWPPWLNPSVPRTGCHASEGDTCEVLGTDSSGGIQIRVAVTNPYKETARVQTWWALRALQVK